MIRRIAMILGLLLLALTFHEDSAGAALRPSRLMTFLDSRSGVALTIQLEPSARDAGRFAFRVPRHGVYEGGAPQAMRVLTPTSVVLMFDGSASLRQDASLADSLSGTAPSQRSIRLQAQLDPTHHTAEATLTDGPDRFHLVVAAVGRRDLGPSLTAFEAATVQNDWLAFYSLMSAEITRSYTPAEFAAQGTAQQSTAGKVVELRRISEGDTAWIANGTAFVTVTYEARVRNPDGSEGVRFFDVFFVREASEWKLWFSRAR